MLQVEGREEKEVTPLLALSRHRVRQAFGLGLLFTGYCLSLCKPKLHHRVVEAAACALPYGLRLWGWLGHRVARLSPRVLYGHELIH